MKLMSKCLIRGLQSIWVIFLISAFSAGLAEIADAQTYPENQGGFNGLSINYSVTGADLGTPTVVGGFTTYRDYKSGKLTGSRVNITGTAYNEWEATVSLSVSVTDNKSGRKDSFNFTMAGTTSKTFSVGLDIYQDTTDVSFRITESASYGNGESRGLWVGGSLTKGASLTADFSAVPLSGNSPLNVEFYDMSTGGTVTSWKWEFLGTNYISTVKNPEVTFTTSNPDGWGVDVKLTVTTDGGLTATKTKTDYIRVFPAQPTLDDKAKADIIFNFVEDFDFGEPIFVPKRQETYYYDGMYCRDYLYYGQYISLVTYQEDFYLYWDGWIYIGSVADWLYFAGY